MARLFGMDLGRTVAITLVTAFHIWRFIGQPAVPVGSFDLYGAAARGYIGVDVFFVVSGYAMMLT